MKRGKEFFHIAGGIPRPLPPRRSPLKRSALKPRKAGLRARSESQRAVATRKADREWQEAVCQQAGRRCERCGSVLGVSGHHLIRRDHLKTRHELKNGLALCNYHHQMAHDKPAAFWKWLAEVSPTRAAWVEEHRRTKSMNLQEIWDKHSDDEFLQFERVQNKLSIRPDIHAFMLLDKLATW